MMKCLKPVTAITFMLLFAAVLNAQDVDLDKMLDEKTDSAATATHIVEKTFIGTRLINGQSIENTQKGILDLILSHRFGTIDHGAYDLFGLDNASMRIGLDYGVSDRLTVGAGRSTFQKQFDGFVKYRILRQTTGERTMPVSVSFLSSIALKTLKDANTTIKTNYSDRLFYAQQVIIARKFSDAFSLQLMPTFIHYNIVPETTDPNDLISVGVGARVKLTKVLSLNAEYYYQLPDSKLTGSYNSLSVGLVIETAGHVFQLHFTNSTGMTERSFITETTNQWGEGQIHFGFNISRAFSTNHNKTK